MARLDFALFIAPLHNLGQSPHLCLRRDIELALHCEHIGYDEVWFGEHHSGGNEFITSPEIFIAHVAALTKNIKLATGAISLTYHNPLWVADRLIMLDHLTRGRLIAGIGPGSLANDAHMIGLDMTQLRDALEEDAEVLMHLLTSEEPLSVKTDRYTLVDAMCMVRPYSDPLFEIAIPAVSSAVAPRLAGKFGGGIISMASSAKAAAESLTSQWDMVETVAAEHNRPTDRKRWRITSNVYIAESEDQALEDIRYGFMTWYDYYQKNTSHPAFTFMYDTFEERLQYLKEVGMLTIGTPDDAIETIEAFQENTGGFGCFVQFHHEWASFENMKRHHELFAQYVMPHFQGQLSGPAKASDMARKDREGNLSEMKTAIESYSARKPIGPSQ
jgi:limonene 1,2-monooxygenase